jgi:hypothetical protein
LAAARELARLYAAARLFVNFFQPSFKLWAATIKVRTNDNQDENVPVGAGRREGVARP